MTKRFSFAVCALVLAAPIRAQQAKPVLDVQVANGQTTFHIGERIPLVLTFTTPNDTGFLIYPYESGHGGEFDSDRFNVTPATGWADPLATYLSGGLMSGHGWGPQPFLAAKPVVLKDDLNQWVRFDAPGDYTLKVVSYRVILSSNKPGDQYPLESNTIALRIVPATPEWEAAVLAAVTANSPHPEKTESDLRYLESPAAIEEMTARLPHSTKPGCYECQMGLIGLPDSLHETAIAAMNRRMDEPNFGISVQFFETMSFLHIDSGANEESIRRQRYAFDADFWQTVFAGVARKQPEARAMTLQTLLRYGRQADSPAVKAQMASLVRASFPGLEMREQIDNLRQHWDLLRSPEILPTLQKLARTPAKNDDNLGPYSTANLKAEALRRWYEMDPAGARREILAQFGSTDPTPPRDGSPQLSGQMLNFLPSEPLPQYEPLWAEAYLHATDWRDEAALGSLLLKFGTGAASSQMLAKLNEPAHINSCVPNPYALAYLARFSPDQARPLLKNALAGNGGGCDATMLYRMPEVAQAPVIHEAAVEALNSPEPRMVQTAAQYLAAYGTAADEKPLLARYAKWTQEWAGKADILDHPDGTTYNAVIEGTDLASALIAAPGWFADPARIANVLQGCVGQQVCTQVKALADTAKPPYRVLMPPTPNQIGTDVATTYIVGQYNMRSRELFESKVKQYPAGSTFMLFAFGNTEDQRKLEDEVRGILIRNGMTVVKQGQ
jgi:hypothetical protein